MKLQIRQKMSEWEENSNQRKKKSQFSMCKSWFKIIHYWGGCKCKALLTSQAKAIVLAHPLLRAPSWKLKVVISDLSQFFFSGNVIPYYNLFIVFEGPSILRFSFYVENRFIMLSLGEFSCVTLPKFLLSMEEGNEATIEYLVKSQLYKISYVSYSNFLQKWMLLKASPPSCTRIQIDL